MRWFAVVLAVYALLVAVNMISSGFNMAAGGQEGAERLFSFATNPVMGFVVGAFATALIQSSSTVTSVIVGLVAGGLPVPAAIPMIMGANIGTTVTNTLVSMGHIGAKKQFRRAFAAATVHDFFNVMAVAIFLPLEIFTHFLAHISRFLSELVLGEGSLSLDGLNFVKSCTGPAVTLVEGFYAGFSALFAGAALALTGLTLIFVAILTLGKLLKVLMVGRAKRILHGAIGHGPLAGIASGTLITMAVQSSSTSTSLIVPLAGSGLFKLKEVYPFTLGANIGTCLTALMAATVVEGDLAGVALQIAFVHLLFNVFAVAGIYGTPFLRRIPMWLAQRFAFFASRNKWIVLLYIVGLFFVLPAVLILLTL